MTETVLAQVLRALDVAVIERLEDSRFQILGIAPAWLALAFETADGGQSDTLGGAMPFLGHFVHQADRAWHDRGSARADSGPFAATFGGEEALLRATALTAADRSLLVLERLSGDADTRPILQKAREQLLETEQLTRHASAVQEPVSAISRVVAELAAADLPPAHRAQVDALRAASARLQAAADLLPKPPPKGRRFAR